MSGVSNLVNLVVDGTFTLSGAGNANKPQQSITGNGTGPALQVTASNTATSVGAKISGGGATMTSSVLDVDASTTTGGGIQVETNNTAGTHGLLVTGTSVAAISIETTNPELDFKPGAAGNAYKLRAGANPGQNTTISFVDPGVAASNLMIDNTAGTVTQLTSNTTAVTLNKRAGLITMFGTLGNGASAAFTLNNSYIVATSQVLAFCQNTVSGTTFVSPSVVVSAIAGGSCTITVTNNDTGHAQAAAAIVQFIVI